MTKTNQHIARLVWLRNNYSAPAAREKLQLLRTLEVNSIKYKKQVEELYRALLFIAAYPNNRAIADLAGQMLEKLALHLQSNPGLQYELYNSGITGTKLCAAFSFELVKWIRKTRRKEIKLTGFEADDAKIGAVLSVVMSKTESEILQDGNAEWKGWLKKMKRQGTDLLDQFIDIFDSSDIRPELKEELWNTIGPNVEIDFVSHCRLPEGVTQKYFHRSLAGKGVKTQKLFNTRPAILSEKEAEQVMDCSRMILVRKLRELDPISFTSAKYISVYHLPRGISIALTGMEPTHRHPLDSYMGYLVFKNGWPVAYAGSWILFDSARIGLNVFADYRGGEAKYIFDQVLRLHADVYQLKRFTVDPYQLGKGNSDGIRSGAFWIYYHAGFRPLKKEQQDLAAAEAAKIKADPKYRSSAAVLKILADSRMELILDKRAVRFDVTDLSRTFASILTEKYEGNRQRVAKDAGRKLAAILRVKDPDEEPLRSVLRNWALIVLSKEKELREKDTLKKQLQKIILLKAGGREEDYIAALQKSTALRKFISEIIQQYYVEDK